MAAKVETAAINAVYKVNLHCHECACEIKRPLLRAQGVHQVEFDLEKNEVKVKGSIDVVAIHKRIERLSKRKVDLISPKTKVAVKEAALVATEKKLVVAKETKEVAARTIQIKAFMHCDQCERDLRTKLLRHRGIFSVKTDMKAQTLTVQGSIENEKLLRYIQKRVNKRAEIITSKVVEKNKKTELETTKLVVETKTATSDIVEFSEEINKKVVEVKTVEGNPYFIHYVYAPQIFSDENPNACSLM